MVKKYLVPASLWRRFFSFVVDIFILELVLFPLSSVVTRSLPVNVSLVEYLQLLQSPVLASLLFKVSVVASFFFVAYFSVFEFFTGQTPGKYLFKLRIVSKQLSFWRVLLSNVFLLTFVPLMWVLWIVDLVHLFSKHQRFLEKLGCIMVVQSFGGSK